MISFIIASSIRLWKKQRHQTSTPHTYSSWKQQVSIQDKRPFPSIGFHPRRGFQLANVTCYLSSPSKSRTRPICVCIYTHISETQASKESQAFIDHEEPVEWQGRASVDGSWARVPTRQKKHHYRWLGLHHVSRILTQEGPPRMGATWSANQWQVVY